jgi:hypothetical protein
MEVYDRCGDEWITAGMDGLKLTISGPSIESAMNVTGITGQNERAETYDKVKLISRNVAQELAKEREKQQEKRQEQDARE